MPAIAVAEIVGGGLALAEGAAGFAAIAAVGAVAAGIGTLTGDSDLAKIGSVVGVIGGIGMAANAAGLLGPATETAQAGAQATASAETTAAEGASAASESGAVAQQTTEGLINTGAPTADTIGKTTSAVQKVEPVSAAIETADAALPSQAEVAKLSAGKAPSFLEMIKQYADPALKFAKDNQMLTYGMMQVGGNFVSGLLDPTKPAQIKGLEARANAEQAQAGLLNSRMANMNQPAPVASSTVAVRPNVYVTGSPAPVFQPPRVGLLNMGSPR